MRDEPPDQLTARVWQMLADARTSALTREEATVQATLFLRRNLSYLARREGRDHHASYDELFERGLAALVRLVVVCKTDVLHSAYQPPLLVCEKGGPPPAGWYTSCKTG